ncbi:MAG: DNA replication protein DnaC [Ruminococcaceae bacterium]|nr:DNA replication protein DnaC [Oscillospiraceae bacterium]
MAYSKDVMRRARARLDVMRTDRQSLQEQRLHSAYAQLPRLQEIDMRLRQTMAEAARTAFLQSENAHALMEKVRQENQALQREREALVAANFPEDYLLEGPLCERCGGLGYIGAEMCSCLKNLCQEEQKNLLTRLACGTASFRDFRLDYYPDSVDPKYSASPRQVMARTYDYCKKYAQNFTANSGNLLFVGGTGLGKTMLSACIATEVTENGFMVSYESAGHLFSKLEKNRFMPSEETAMAVAEIENAQLLIIDDLGTEMPSSFVTAALYSLINDRILSGKPTIISTNLNAQEIAARYSPQIASRLQGNFRKLTFVGEDIRLKRR